jgi:hypothetical protein
MHDAGKIVTGLVVFLAVVTSPLWYRLVVGGDAAPPELAAPSEGKQCVESTPYMRTLHMDLLNAWRDESHRAPDGQVYDKSLTGTCLRCHANKAEFCDRCHGYAAVQPYCWECHVDPREAR